MQGTGQTVELRAVHRLPDGNPATSQTCNCTPRNPTEDRKEAGRLEGRPPQDARGRHPNLRTCAQYLTAAHREESEEHRAQNFHSLVLQGKLRTAVRWITDRETGGVLQPAERYTNTGERVMEVLHTKHLEALPPTVASLDLYPDCPLEIVLVDITNNTLTSVVGRLSGGDGPGGTDSVRLQNWLLRFGAASGELRLIVTYFTEWLSNGQPTWYAYRAIMSGRLIALDKQPGVRTVGVGETWRRLMTKCLIWVTGQESKAACRTKQLAGDVEAGIEGGIHAMCVLCQENSQEEDWGFLLIDAQNAFNEENRTTMLWAIWHEWPSGSQLTFNCYLHWATLVVRDTGDGSGHFLHSKEGVTQGDPIAMIPYGIGSPPPHKKALWDTPPGNTAVVRG